MRAQLFALSAILDVAFGGQAVDLAVVVKALMLDGDDDGHRLVLGRAAQADLCLDAAPVVEAWPGNRYLPRLRADLEGEPRSLAFKGRISFCAVARQGNAASQGDNQAFLVQITGSEV